MAQRTARAAFRILTALALASMAGCTTDSGGGTTAVESTLISATLAEDCGGGGLADAPGRCEADTECPSFCQQTSVQISFDATQMDTAVPVEIVSVRLLDADSGASLGVLSARNPQQWQNESYVAWDSQLLPGSELRTSYQLSAPDWASIGGSGFASYEDKYILEVTVRIDGVEQKLRSAELSREPLVAT